MDQAYSLRNMVERKNKILYILKPSNYHYERKLYLHFASVLKSKGFKVICIGVGEELETPECTDSIIYISVIDNHQYIKKYNEYNIDVIALTNTVPESVLEIYSQIKMMILNNTTQQVEYGLKLAIGPVEDVKEAQIIQQNITSALKEYLNCNIDYLGWFSDLDNDIKNIILKYLDWGDKYAKNS